MKIINLIRCEFIKNYTLKKYLIICIVLLISSIVITEFNVLLKKEGLYPVNSELEYAYNEYDIRSKDTSNLTLKQSFDLNSVNNRIKMLEQIKKIGNVRQDSWQLDVLFDIYRREDDVFVIKQIIDNKADSSLSIINDYSGIQYEQYEGIIKQYYSINENELKKIINKKELEIKELKELVKSNKYYKYVDYLLNNNEIIDDSLKNYEKIVNDKIETDSNYRVRYLYQKSQISSNLLNDTISENNYNKDSYYTTTFKNYKSYLRYNGIFQRLSKEKLSIINYSIENNMKHDINFTDADNIDNSKYYMNTKLAVNQILNLSIIIVILVSITSGGIVSNEHIKGTEKLLLTSPIKRWKVLLGKFIYVILHSYVIWVTALFILSIYAGFRFGFSDLFTPKLVYFDNRVIEVNYLLYVIKDMFVCSIPIICFISILLALSTITLNTSLTIGVTTILGCISSLIWYIISTYKLSILAYTPLPYFNFSLVINMYGHYFDTIKFANINLWIGLGICLITTFILYSFTNFIYIKRDIKN